MKVSVIMPSFLGLYQGSASNREDKFIRAVNSFLTQSFADKELVIISDGCSITNDIVSNKFKHKSINHISIPKQDSFSGNVREIGLRNTDGNIICYLDTDDYFASNNHIENIALGFDNFDWVYFNDFVKWNPHVCSEREAIIERGRIGTSNIAHRNFNDISWNKMDGYGHDWFFISNLNAKYKSKKIFGTSYTVCHIPNSVDC